jgi:hypothetical protein
MPGGEPPYVLVVSEGTEDGARVLAGQARTLWTFRCVGGAWDHDASAAELDALKQTVMETFRDLAGWQVGSVGPDGLRDWQGGSYLTADVAAARLIDI